MKYAIVFMSWAPLMLLYFIAGALLIPYERRYSYARSPKDAAYYVSNGLWWGVPLTWFLAPSVPSVWARASGAILFTAGAALLIWARRVNPFFLPVVREPRWVVMEGPYRFTRHPGYMGLVVMAEGSWLMLGHWTGVFPLCAYIGFLVALARRENRILYATRSATLDANSGASNPARFV
jgi:protein-S-isoprenylcysteine O-methyltransferase Ste14